MCGCFSLITDLSIIEKSFHIREVACDYNKVIMYPHRVGNAAHSIRSLQIFLSIFLLKEYDHGYFCRLLFFEDIYSG